MFCSYCRLILKLYIRSGLPLIKISYHETIFIIFSLIIPILSVAQKTIKVSYEQKFIYNDSFFNQLPEDSREELKALWPHPPIELTNNGDLSLYESVNTKEKLLPQKRKVHQRIKI
jgi:hypothetical protein